MSETDVKAAAPPVWQVLSISALAIFLAALLGIELTRSAGNVASVWLASGVTIGLMLRWRDRLRQALVFIVSGVAILAANLICGDPFPVALGLTAANLAGVLTIIAGLGLAGWHPREIDDSQGFLKFALVALIVGPMVAAVIGALVINSAYGAPYASVLRLWFLSDTVGNFILAPALISLGAEKRLLAHLRLFGLCLAGLIGVTFLVPDQIDKAAEVEPFKTAITTYFVREWYYVAYAAFWLLSATVLFKGFCRYVCPLGAVMAIGGLIRGRDWIARRSECGSPCQLCRVKCQYQAITPKGDIQYSECFQCLDCVSIHDDATRCVPLIIAARRAEKV